MTQPNTLSKEERLRGKKRIDRLFTASQGGFCYPFRWVLLAESIDIVADDEEVSKESDERFECREMLESGASVLFSVPKKNIRRANKRNLLKRRMREAYRLNKHSFVSAVMGGNKKMSVAFLYVAKEPLEYDVIEPAIKKILVAMEKEC